MIYLIVTACSDDDESAQETSQTVISAVNPEQGPPGTQVFIIGENFDPDPANNIVQFNGSTAPVTAATATQLITTVPEGALSGPVTITINENTISGPAFTVTESAAPPVIISISPVQGTVNSTLTITGSNFSVNPVVTINGVSAAVASFSSTEIVVTVPATATTGAVLVTVNGQTASGPTFTVI